MSTQAVLVASLLRSIIQGSTEAQKHLPEHLEDGPDYLENGAEHLEEHPEHK